MHLHTTCLYDIVTGYGKSLLDHPLEGIMGETKDIYLWPPQPSPNKKYGKSGRHNYSASIGCQDKTLPRHRQLGQCISGDLATIWIYSIPKDRIYQQTKEGWQAYRLVIKIQGKDIHERFISIGNEIVEEPPISGSPTKEEKL